MTDNDEKCIELNEIDKNILFWILDKYYELKHKKSPEIGEKEEGTFEILLENIKLNAYQTIVLILSNFMIINFYYYTTSLQLKDSFIRLIIYVSFVLYSIGIILAFYMGVFRSLKTTQQLKKYKDMTTETKAVFEISEDKQVRTLSTLLLDIYLQRILKHYEIEKLCPSSKALIDIVKKSIESSLPYHEDKS